MKMKQLCMAIFALFFVANLLAVPALAAETTADYTIRYSDGSYAVVTIKSSITRLSADHRSTYIYYDPQGQKCFGHLLYASFTYNGFTSQADSCTYASEIYRMGWNIASHSEYVAGSTAYGNATYTGPNGQVPVHLTLTCDRNGNAT